MMKTEGICSFLNQQLKLDNEQTVEEVARKIEMFSPLDVLDLRGNTLGVVAGERLAIALRKHPELKRCIWSDMFTGRLKTEIPPILKSLCGAMMSANCRITELDLSDNAFGPIGADGIADFLVSPSAYQLTTLRLNNNGLGAGGKRIAACLLQCIKNAEKDGQKFALKRFIAGRNRLEDPGALALSEAFSNLGTLEEIRIPQNGIRANGVKALAKAFEANPHLQVIDINDNTCTVTGAIEIAEILPSLNDLIELDLGDCLCRDEGVTAILANLVDSDRKNLQKVNLSGNELSAYMVEEVGSAFAEPELSHVKVNLTCNNMGSLYHDVRDRFSRDANLDFGESDDDQGTLSCDDETLSDEDNDMYEEEDDEEELGADDDSMEDEGNTSRDTAINMYTRRSIDTDKALEEMVTKGFGCMRVAGTDDDTGFLSFLDQQLKMNTANDAETVAQKIEDAAVVHTLELRGNTVGVEAGKRLARALEKHPELQRCLWSDMFTGRLKTEIPPILQSLGASMIKARCQITELDLSDNAFGPIGADGIKELLESRSCFTLQTLKLNNNGLGIGGKSIAASLSKCHDMSFAANDVLRLQTFVAGRNRLEDPGATALASTFKKLKTLERIEVPQNGINKKGIEELAEAMKHNKNLRVFNINDNTTTQLGAFAIAKNLAFVPLLEVLDLGDCLCRDQGCHAIIDHLSPDVHTKLQEVNLSGAELSPQAAQLIARKWRKFDKLNPKPVLKIGANNFGNLFEEVRNCVTSNVDIGESDDDCGSLSSDEEERNSGGSSSEEDEEDEGRETQANNSMAENTIRKCAEHVDSLGSEYESRVQEASARLLIQLAVPIKESNYDENVFEKAVLVAEEVVRRVAAVKRNPIPTTTQLVNHCVAQCGNLGVKPETYWGLNVDQKTLGKLLRELLARGHFEMERETIQYYFKP